MSKDQITITLPVQDELAELLRLEQMLYQLTDDAIAGGNRAAATGFRIRMTLAINAMRTLLQGAMLHPVSVRRAKLAQALLRWRVDREHYAQLAARRAT